MLFFFRRNRTVQHVLRCACLTLLLAMTLQISFSAGLNAQGILERRVSLSMVNKPLKEVLQALNQKTSIDFVYSSKVDVHKVVSVQAQNKELRQVLKDVLTPTRLDYEVVGTSIVIKESPVPTPVPVLKKSAAAAPSLPVVVPVRGKVVDDKGEPLPGVTVLVKGTQTATVTDANGAFSIEAPANASLMVSYLGFLTQEVKVGSQQELTVKLVPDPVALGEVVVTGYTVQEKRVVTGAIGQIKSREIANMPIQSFDQAMQGRLAGVQVQTASGVPGGKVSINIRGMGSITAGNEPLYIVDGVQINSEDDAGGTVGTNPLSFLNPNDIESIEVLKDAAAASIYGAQAANGVVLITTKSGDEGPTKISVNMYRGFASPLPLIKMMDSQQYLDVRMEAYRNRYPDRTEGAIRTEVLQESMLPINMTDAQLAALPTYDWQKAAFRTGDIYDVELAASGGNKTTTYRLSASYNSSEGNLIGIDFSRATAKLRVQHKPTRKLTISTNINLSNIVQNGTQQSAGSTGFMSAPQFSSPMILPFIPITLEDGSPNNPLGGFPGELRYNPIYTAEVNFIQGKTRALYSNIILSYDITKDLNFKSTWGLDYRNINAEQYLDPRTHEAYARRGYLSIRNRESSTVSGTQALTYSKRFAGGHRLTALAGAEYRDYSRQISFSAGEGFSTYQFRHMSGAATILSSTGSWTGYRQLGFFSQANYDYKKKYMASAILRYDGSSKFGANNRFGLFPAFSAGWDIAAEDFLKDVRWVDQFKLRVGYGETGNSAIDHFASRGLFTGSSSYGGQPAIQPSSLENPDLRWERNASTNLGVDFSLFRKRLSGSVDAFHRRSKDLLLEQPVPWYGGYESMYRNVGEVVNRGLEVELNGEVLRVGGFQWNSGFNITFMDNEVTKLYEGLNGESLPGNPSVRIGHPLRTNFVAQYAGVNSATGRPMWWSGNGTLTYNPGAQGTNSYTPYGRGSQLAKYFGGFTNTLSFKGIEVSALFQYDMGREYLNEQNRTWYRNGQGARNGLERIYLMRWTEPGQVTPVPRAINGGAETDGATHILSSSRFLEDASYIRFKQLAASYAIPARFLSKFKISSARVYAQAVNLYTWTAWTGYDPEFLIDDENFTSNQGVVPQTRSYTLGVEFGF
ncbi:TonB-dependent receptor [Rufibacter quisquiliarum]|nr:TonB-dependent receptor [Rufibacter quisquiliarum]